MDRIRQEGKTVEEAVDQALAILNINKDEAEINVIEEGNPGFLGFIGSKNALVEVKVKKNPVKIGKEFLEEVFSNTNLDVEINIIEDKTNSEQVVYNLNSPDLGIVIGHRGETLDALQYLTSLVVNKNIDNYFRVLLDAEGYRDRRKQTLIRLAKKLARKCLKKGRKVVLEPMPPHERRIIHMTLKDDPRVNSYSEGEEPFRKVMIEATEKNDS
ncbi:MAG: RNA-binding cell elongation regulator Jag/EloR [Halanaerobiaceae bacterium]